MGFIQSAFMGKYIYDNIVITDVNGKNGTVTNFNTYVIFNPLSTTQQYASAQSGYLGLGPYTTDKDAEKEDSIMYQL